MGDMGRPRGFLTIEGVASGGMLREPPGPLARCNLLVERMNRNLNSEVRRSG